MWILDDLGTEIWIIKWIICVFLYHFSVRRIVLSGVQGLSEQFSDSTMTHTLLLTVRLEWNMSELPMLYFMEIEDKIEFAHISKIFVKHLYEWMDEFQDDEFIIGFVNNSDEVETCITLVDNFIFFVVDEIAHLGFAGDDQLIHLMMHRNFTSFRNLCFSCCDKFVEYHFVNRDRPCRLIRKKQWIIFKKLWFNY